MKKEWTVGCSENTFPKLQDLECISDTHIRIVQYIIKKHLGRNSRFVPDVRYFYYDIYAGPGRYPDDNGLPSNLRGQHGSPYIFLLKAQRYNSIKYDVTLIEQEDKVFESLEKTTAEFTENSHIDLKLEHGNNKELLLKHVDKGKVLFQGRQIYTAKYGILYIDSNGIPDFNLIRDFYEAGKYPYGYSTIDVLINCPAGIIKRTNNTEFKSDISLKDEIKKIRKKFWFVREPYGAAQWSFLLGTNWEHMPGEFKKHGRYGVRLHNINSPEGKVIFDKLCYTKDELYNICNPDDDPGSSSGGQQSLW